MYLAHIGVAVFILGVSLVIGLLAYTQRLVNNLREDNTIIIIAHRLNTVRKCDFIFELEKGTVINKGTFNDLF